MTNPVKAVVAYVNLTRANREKLAEVDLRQLEAAELVVRDMPVPEFLQIVRANKHAVKL